MPAFTAMAAAFRPGSRLRVRQRKSPWRDALRWKKGTKFSFDRRKSGRRKAVRSPADFL